jgi:transposase-like protein
MSLEPQRTVLIADTTFWGRRYGVCVFRSASLKRNIWWNEVDGERVTHYHYGRKIMEEKGWTFCAAVVDGRRGLTSVFKDIPVQLCLFHQIKQVTKYLTRRPQTDAGKELRVLALTLTKTTEEEFTRALSQWHTKWEPFINEKTEDVFIRRTKWYYTHNRVRCAYHSLKRNLPYLFTYERFPELNIPKTTNSLDGFFSALKKRLGVHHGLRRDRRYKVISAILKGRA